jgi:hypothetical protein
MYEEAWSITYELQKHLMKSPKGEWMKIRKMLEEIEEEKFIKAYSYKA